LRVPVIVSLDGTLVDPAHAAISVFDRGLLYGDGCFEVLRTWGGMAVELPAHLDRLFESLAVLRLTSITRAEIATAVGVAVRAAGEGEHRIRIVVTRGPGGLATPIEQLGPGRSIVIVEPLGALPAELSVAVVRWPLPAREGRGHKTLAYLDHVLARELARAAGADEAIRLGAAGDVVEGASSNVFVVRGGAVATPAIEGGVLPGIVRARVLAVCAAHSIPAREGRITLQDLRTADEAFVTSSLRGVVAITSLDGQSCIRGPITQRIATAYATEMTSLVT
jgi:branched-chain amino acid aminotransferase